MDWSSLNIPCNLFKLNLDDKNASDVDTEDEEHVDDGCEHEIISASNNPMKQLNNCSWETDQFQVF